MAEPRQPPSKPNAALPEPRARAAPGKAALPIWRTAIARKLFAVACLVAAAGLEYYLVNLPVGEVKEQFPAIRARDEIVTFGEPGLLGGGTFSFMSAPSTEAEKVRLEAYFDNAQLSEPTLQSFKSFQISAPSSSGVITYQPSGAENAACSTKMQVEPAGANLKSVEFSQSGNDITSGYRSLGASFGGTDAVVTLTSQGAFQSGLSPCKKIELSIGDWKQVTQGFLPIKIRVPAGAHFRFYWKNLDERSSTWSTKSTALDLLRFGSSASDQFTAQTIAISPLNPKTGAPDAPSFEARGAKQSPLTVLSFGVNQNQLEIKASGKGRVLKEGKVVNTTDVLETLNKNPILSALFGAGNLALIGWAGRMFFPPRRNRKSKH